MTVNVCAKMCVSECVCAAFLPSLKAWKHNYALTQRHRPAFHMTHWAPVFGHKSTAAGVEVAPHKHGSMLETGGWVLRLHYPALKCSCLHGSRTVRHSVCVYATPMMFEWHTMDRTAAAVRLCSLCFTGSLEKALFTIKKTKTFRNTVHLPQFTTSAASTSAN